MLQGISHMLKIGLARKIKTTRNSSIDQGI